MKNTRWVVLLYGCRTQEPLEPLSCTLARREVHAIDGVLAHHLGQFIGEKGHRAWDLHPLSFGIQGLHISGGICTLGG